MRPIYAIALLLFLMACNDKPADTGNKNFQEELKSREIKKISDGEIIDAAFKKGNVIADSAQKRLGFSLKMALADGGVANALKYCNVSAYPLMDSIQKDFGAEIKRVSLKARNPKDKPNEMEKGLLEAYQYQVESGDVLSPNIQKIGTEYLLYTKPITIQDGLCLNCHGERGKYVKEDDYQLIQYLYPEDNAMGHKMGELRGMWSIKFERKEIIKSL